MDYLKHCNNCGKFFNDLIGKGLCPNCKEKNDELLKEIKKYVKENNRVTMMEVSEKFKVSTRQILRWIEQEELELNKNDAIKLYCKTCNTQILCGVYCDKCKAKTLRQLNSVYITNEAKQKIDEKDTRMRFINKNNKK